MNRRHNNQRINKAVMISINEAKDNFPSLDIFIIGDIGFDIKGCKKINSLEEIKNIRNSIIICYFKNDEEQVKTIKEIKELGGKFLCPPIAYPIASYIHKNSNAALALKKSKKDCKDFGLQYYSAKNYYEGKLKDFINIMQALEITKDLEGDYVEIGTFMGASGNAALHYLKLSSIKRKCYFIDTFKGFDYLEAKNSVDAHWPRWPGNEKFNGNIKNSVRKMFDRFNLPYVLKEMNVCVDNIPKEINQIAVCNLDVDIYDAVLSGLKKVSPLIVNRGIIIVEDPGHTPLLSGAQLALNEFLESEEGKRFTPIYMESGQYFLVKSGNN